ncbi:hypothetical protein QC762_601180 [Podospora pseudocomata]|uniref:Glucose receptor Git3 N-terminal domain-containing protein n=1 Tax=Podospora pseudocomata TaxID=2093779 RepID=A0ABR0G7T2_9PEZI|nr:hypothetical protein QC762_601180 [Podospora pseudocomata]
MAAENPHAPENEIDSLTPLPLDHRRGLWGVSVLAGLSFVSSTVLLVYLTVKLVRWHLKQWRLERQQSTNAQAPSSIDLTLGLAERHFFPPCRRNNSRGRENAESTPRKKAYPNQFLVLVYNLLLADIHQASAFLLNAVWLGRDGIIVHTPACWAQGWLVSTGDLSSSCFITAIAVHTYLAVVRNYTPPQRAVYATVIGLWVFNYLAAGLGVIITRNGADGGGLYVRAAAWCWINIHYETHRLALHYLWIFVSLFLTSALYISVFLSLRAKSHTESRLTRSQPKPLPSNQQQKAFLLYPLIYIICTLPLALGRIATMAGAHVPISYFCTAGALIASNGWLDVLLWGVTRHRLIFTEGGIDSEESGIGSFGVPELGMGGWRGSGIIRTPVGRRFGNLVWVHAAGKGEEGRGRGKRRGRNKSDSQETLTGMMGGGDGGRGERGGIKMDTVTSVTVVDVGERGKGL